MTSEKLLLPDGFNGFTKEVQLSILKVIEQSRREESRREESRNQMIRKLLSQGYSPEDILKLQPPLSGRPILHAQLD